MILLPSTSTRSRPRQRSSLRWSKPSAFLTTTYGYQLTAKRVDVAEDPRDTQVIMRYVGDRVVVDVVWDEISILVDVFFGALPPADARAQAPTPAALDEQGYLRLDGVFLDDLAAVRGHADDPDFLQGDHYGVRGRVLTKRFTLYQAHLTDIIEGLARATSRYASDVLRGDTSVFPEVMAYHDQRMEATYS